jgi:Glycerate kinase family
MNVVIAPDKFKGSLTAAEAARHLAAGLRRAAGHVPVVTVPVSDGGDGFLDAMVAAGYQRCRSVLSRTNTQFPRWLTFTTKISIPMTVNEESGFFAAPSNGPSPPLRRRAAPDAASESPLSLHNSPILYGQ